MATRAIWKGAISFGLVHLPVAIHAGSQDDEIDFDWLDARSLDPVGYKRINKRTGREIDKQHVVKGVKLDDGRYVVLSDDDIRSAYPKKTQTIEIQTFVKAEEVSFVYLERPYYLAPETKAQRVYALLREALAKAGVVGIARFVLHNKEHLAAVLPAGPALMLGTLRWASEIRSAEPLELPPEGAGANRLKPAELKMAQQLIAQMTSEWKPQDYRDEFGDAIRALVERKAAAGEAAEVEPMEEAPPPAHDNVVDLTELLRRSLGGAGKGKPSTTTARRKTAARKAASPPAAKKSRRRA